MLNRFEACFSVYVSIIFFYLFTFTFHVILLLLVVFNTINAKLETPACFVWGDLFCQLQYLGNAKPCSDCQFQDLSFLWIGLVR